MVLPLLESLNIEQSTNVYSDLDPQAALDELTNWMGTFKSALIAYSGGVDSAVVLAVASKFMGPRAVGCIGVSPSYPKRELNAATQLADKIGATYRLVNTEEHLNPRYAANPSNRCYFCKSELYGCLSLIAKELQTDVILDGTNASDLGQHRPGYAAAREQGVRSPLAELGINKATVRAIAQKLDLTVWDKPASPCLASRVPTGIAIVPQLLTRIEKAEDVLVQLGLKEFRVRHHGDVARIELPVDSLIFAFTHRDKIVSEIKAAGYRFVTLDLAGLKSGSLNS